MLKKCCFTGYRPEKLPYLKDSGSREYKRLKTALENAVDQAIEDGYTYFISGFARGIDLMAADIVLAKGKGEPAILLEAAIPCLDQAAGWGLRDAKLYKSLLAQANYKVYLDKRPDKNCYLERNRYMVDCSQRIIGVFDGQKGGTAHTITYGRRLGRELVIIDPHTFKAEKLFPESTLF
ncbi:MAG: SLOG family protein [Bacillota bacterium]|nr:SLOG family protein [Bacillota bacterium]